jgi:hypothetical protein
MALKRPEDAAKAIGLGLELVAIGQALVINPNGMEMAIKGEKVAEAKSLSKLPAPGIPGKLWNVIDAAKGWFQVAD